MQPQIPEGFIILIVITDIHPLRLDTSCNEHLCPLTKWRRHDVKPPIQSVTARRTLKHNLGRQVFLSPGANQHHLCISIVIISWSLTCFNISSSMTETSIPYLSFFFPYLSYLTRDLVTLFPLDFINALSRISTDYFLIRHREWE